MITQKEKKVEKRRCMLTANVLVVSDLILHLNS